MISYLREQPRTQALADALRGVQASNGGTQMPQRSSGFVGNPSVPQPDFNQYGGRQQGSGMDGMGKIGKAIWDKTGGASSGNPFGDTNAGSWLRSGWEGIAGSPTHSAATVRGGAPMSGAAEGGFISSLGPAMAAIGASFAADNLLNNSDKDKWYNANKINNYGTVGIGGKDVGFRGGDLMNGLNPVTWMNDPKKGATGLFNFFTGGLFD